MLFSSLTKGTVYGTSSHDIYMQLCYHLGFDKDQGNQFGWHKPLFARLADTDRTRDVWFICHSNYSGSKSENGKHINTITDNVISEYYRDSKYDVYPMNDRITFAKNQRGEYVFIGVYRPDDPYSKEQGRLFTLVRETYPVKQ